MLQLCEQILSTHWLKKGKLSCQSVEKKTTKNAIHRDDPMAMFLMKKIRHREEHCFDSSYNIRGIYFRNFVDRSLACQVQGRDLIDQSLASQV